MTGMILSNTSDAHSELPYMVMNLLICFRVNFEEMPRIFESNRYMELSHQRSPLSWQGMVLLLYFHSPLASRTRALKHSSHVWYVVCVCVCTCVLIKGYN